MPDIEAADTPGSARSPCVDICRMDPVIDVCIGCFRTLKEISTWSSMTVEQKHAVLAQLPARRAQMPVARSKR